MMDWLDSKGFRGLIASLVFGAVVFGLLSTSFRNFQVDGRSMDPNVKDGEFLVVNKAAYHDFKVGRWVRWLPFLDRDGDGHVMPFGEPQRGDVLVFHDPITPGRNLIKRIIGLPGEIIAIREGTVLINGEPLQEDYVAYRDDRSLPARRVPPRHLFLMGDERQDSYDSRAIGPVPMSTIIGKAWGAYWPPGAIGIVRNLTPAPASK